MYSGREIKYLRLMVQRSNILIGNSAMNSSKFVITMYRKNPIRIYRC